MRRLIASVALLIAAPLFAQLPITADPKQYVTITMPGFPYPVTVPTLPTVARQTTTLDEQSTIAALVTWGFVTPHIMVDDLKAMLDVFCSETAGQVAGCSDTAAAAAPYQQELSLIANNVPAADWVIGNYHTLMSYAPAPPPPPPPTGAIVGTCVALAQATICYPGPGAASAMLTDGQIVVQNGMNYLVHITQGLMGKQIYFTPAGPSANTLTAAHLTLTN